MAGVATASEIDEFINGALVSWLESCLSRPEILTGYSSLLDGSILHSVWLQIDPEPPNHPTDIINPLSGLALCIARAKNFECIVRNLKALFEEEFSQTILVLPDTFTLGYHPETRQGLEQMKTLLTLLLGAAVQCPNKELFIARIKELDVQTQHAIVELIKQVTDNHSLVLTSESIDLLSPTTMYNHILRLTKERDNVYMKWISAICIEPESHMVGCADSAANMPLSPVSGGMTSASSVSCTSSSAAKAAANSESNHMAVELADLKSKLRKTRQELEEKAESQLELREELEHKSAQYEKLRAESQEWYAEAKRAAAYRDEVDVLRERTERADRLEIEVQKFREKLTDAEFYKTRVEELREDNRMLLETKFMLEDQLQRSRKRFEHVMTLESEIIKYKQKLNDMALERDVDRSKLEELLEENTQLQLVAKNMNATQDADKSFSDNDDDCNSGDNSLSEQLTNNAQTRALKLELENRRLAAALDQLKETTFHESTTKLLELEKDKKKLALKIEQLQENGQRLAQQNAELEGVFKNALEENRKLQDAVDSRQQAYERQGHERDAERQKLIALEKHVETLSKEKQRVQTLNESIQRRADDLERLLDTRTKEAEQHAARTHEFEMTKERLYDVDAKLMACERENASLTKEVAKLKESLEQKSVQLDEVAAELEARAKEAQRLGKKLSDVEQTQLKITELEKLNLELASQRDIDAETIATLRHDLVEGTLATKKVRHSLEKLGLSVEQTVGEDGAELNVKTVVTKLVRNPETFKTVREIMLTVSKEQQQQQHGPHGSPNATSDICVLCHRKEIYTVEKNIELSSPTSSSSLASGISVPAKIEPQELSFEHKVLLNPVRREAAELTRLSEVNTQLNALNAALQSTNDQLQAEGARLSVDVATLGSQITALNTQHVALQLANSQLAADKDVLLKQVETLRQELKHLLQDQVTLQCLHEQLSAEYESLNQGKEQLKVVVRDLRNETRELNERNYSLEKQIEELSRDNGTMKTCSEDLAILRTEHSKLTDDFRNLFATSDRFKNEYKNIQEQYKMIRNENSKLKLHNTELSGEMSARGDQAKMLEMEYNTVSQRCEMLVHINADLDTDRKTLMDNLSQLLSQYHELLSHSLEDKQHFHEEEKSYAERVHNLCRQKEKLEEKIMEHYKKSESTVPKKKQFASNLVRRVKKASSELMNKVPSRNQRRSWVDDSRVLPPSTQLMIGSESGGNDSDNSAEEPSSISASVSASTSAGDGHMLQRNIPLRQSLQRDLVDSTMMSRGGVVRSSLQAQKRSDLNSSRRSSVHGLEAPDVTGSSLTLGTAGSRRTVYLIDENQKIPTTSDHDTQSTAAGAGGGGANASSSAVINITSAMPGNVSGTSAESQTAMPSASSSSPLSPVTPASTTANTVPAKSDGPATFLMYNRINTMIGGSIAPEQLAAAGVTAGTTAGGGVQQQGVGGAASNADDKTIRKRSEDKSNSIWYEYGCV